MAVAIVTGASRGLGQALSRRLAESGWEVVVDARDGTALDHSVNQAGSAGRRLHPLAGDVTDPEHRRRLVARAAELGGLDLLVHNAGALGPSPLPTLATVDPDVLGPLFDTNVVAPLALTQLALPQLRKARGAVVAVTSDASVEAYEGWGAYGASKAALEQLHHVLAAEEPEIRVYRFDPGDMRTQMHQDAFPDEDISDRAEPDESARALVQLVADAPPSGRYRAAELVAGDRR